MKNDNIICLIKKERKDGKKDSEEKKNKVKPTNFNHSNIRWKTKNPINDA